MRHILIALSLLLMVSATTQAQAQAQDQGQAEPRTEAACDRLNEALAYNACLAELGPRVGERRPALAGLPLLRSNLVQRRPDGRKAATFDVITGSK